MQCRQVLCGGGTRGDFSGGSHLHEKYDWHESQIFRLLLFVVVVKCQRFVRDEKNNNFLEFRALEPYLTAAIIFAKNLQLTIIIIVICRL